MSYFLIPRSIRRDAFRAPPGSQGCFDANGAPADQPKTTGENCRHDMKKMPDPRSRHQLILFVSVSKHWAGLDSNQRRRKPADLQSAPFGHSGTYPFTDLAEVPQRPKGAAKGTSGGSRAQCGTTQRRKLQRDFQRGKGGTGARGPSRGFRFKWGSEDSGAEGRAGRNYRLKGQMERVRGGLEAR